MMGRMSNLLTIGRLATLAGVSTDTIRYYERRGLLPKPGRTAAGYRQYPESAVRRLALVRNARGLGFSLTQVAGFLRVRDAGGRPCEAVRGAGERLLMAIDRQIADLTAARRRMRKVLSDWDRTLAATPAGRPARLLERAAPLVLALLVASPAWAQRVVTYQATIDNVKYVYGPAEPVARVRPGEVIEANTLDAFGNAIRKPGDTMAMVKGDNPLTGPFYVEGAAPGDTLVVTIERLDIDGTVGVGAMAPGFGALNTTTYTPMLNPDLPERIWFYDIDAKNNVATFKATESGHTVKIPMHPFLGCLGVAPPGGESRMSITPGEWGGNMDSPQASPGYTVYLPVNAPGALLYFGDGHAAQGEGEVGGTGIEVPMKVRLSVDLIKGKAIKWPRFENATSIMALGAYRPVDDALRIAFKELIGWIKSDYGLAELDAYELLSKVARVDLNEMVDPNYVVVAIVDKAMLPPKR